MWDPATGACLHILTCQTTSGGTRTVIGYTSEVQALAVAPDGSWLASAGSTTTRGKTYGLDQRRLSGARRTDHHDQPVDLGRDHRMKTVQQLSNLGVAAIDSP
jgi:WD40 repeat protein